MPFVILLKLNKVLNHQKMTGISFLDNSLTLSFICIGIYIKFWEINLFETVKRKILYEIWVNILNILYMVMHNLLKKIVYKSLK